LQASYSAKILANVCRHALAVQQRLVDHYIPDIVKVKFNDQFVEAPTQLQWYPDQLAWQMTTPKNVVRKFPPFASFQKFLVSETSVGNISRQEVVSMIPPLLMDIKPGMTVLDLCAAPGSKSAQLIEAVHGGEEARVRKVLHKLAKEEKREMSPDGMEIETEMAQADVENDYSDDGRTTGLLIANDVDYRRAQMLVHQVKRLNSPNLIVTNHDATMFPSIKISSSAGQPNKYLKFDRILADVPCSGDGTARKNPNVWKDWSTRNALGLHLTQVRILVRALQMLKVGGRVVYSTCSMNPVENEAAVAAAIDRCGGSSKVKILDVSDRLIELKRTPGIKKWKVMDVSGRLWDNWQDVEQAKEKEGDEKVGRIIESMFAPSESEEIPLERCIRVYPHMQDTGGFFITVLEKQTEIKARPEDQKKAAVAEKPVTTMSIVDEIEQKSTNGVLEPGTKLESVDKIAPYQYNPDDDVSNSGNAPATSRQNQDNAEPPPKPSPNQKRDLEDEPIENGAEPPVKKMKVEAMDKNVGATEDMVEEPVVKETEHWPPPPAAQPDINPTEPPPANITQTEFKKKPNQPHEEPFKYLDPEHPELERISNFYELSPRFPRDRFMVRNATGEPVKAVYYTSEFAREIMTENEGKGMKFVHCGVKMFMKQDAQGQDICRWRIQSDGLPILEAWVGEGRIVRLYKRETLRKLLIEMFPKVAQEGWKELGEIGERVRDIGMGCCVLRVETSDGEDGFKERLVLPLWRSLSSVNLMLPKEERK